VLTLGFRGCAVDETFSAQLDAVVRANKLQTTLDEMGVGRPQPPVTVHEEMLDGAAVLLRTLNQRGHSDLIEAWLRDYQLYRDTPAGMEYVWAPETSPKWQLLEQPTQAYACRGSLRCEAVVVARLDRSRNPEKPQWWRYCAGHLFGRRIVDGRLEYRKLVKKGDSA